MDAEDPKLLGYQQKNIYQSFWLAKSEEFRVIEEKNLSRKNAKGDKARAAKACLQKTKTKGLVP